MHSIFKDYPKYIKKMSKYKNKILNENKNETRQVKNLLKLLK